MLDSFKARRKKGNLPNCVLGTYNVYIYIYVHLLVFEVCTVLCKQDWMPLSSDQLKFIYSTQRLDGFCTQSQTHLTVCKHEPSNDPQKQSMSCIHIIYIHINIFNRILQYQKKLWKGKYCKWVGNWNQNTLKKIRKHWQILINMVQLSSLTFSPKD